MATGAKMSYNYYQSGKHGTLPQNAGSSDTEVSHDMHLKMSKKIAQLTKVIYALNTKNDEHENIMQALRDQHEEQLQQLMGETKQKLEHYSAKLSSISEQSKVILELRTYIEKQETEKSKALEEFQHYKERVEAKEFQTKTEHGQKLLGLSQEVLKVKKEFAESLSSISDLKSRYEGEKVAAVAELEEKHKHELEAMKLSLSSNDAASNESRKKLEEEYRKNVANLEEKLSQLQADKERLIEEHELKLSKAKAFHEKELEILRNSQNASHEEQFSQLQESYNKLKQDAEFQAGVADKRHNKLLGQISSLEDELQKRTDELTNVQTVLQNKDSASTVTNQQLKEAKHQLSSVMSQLKQVETELSASKLRCDHQAQSLLAKSTEIGELDATRLQNQSTIDDLQAQLGQLRDRVKWLEGSKKSIESQSVTEAEERAAQLRALERALEDMSTEKQTIKERLERELRSLQELSAQTEQKLKDEHQRSLREERDRHKEEMECLSRNNATEMDAVRQSLEEKLRDETKQHETETQTLKEEYDKTRSHLSNKLENAESEVSRLEAMLSQHEQGLGSATTQLNSLRDASDRLKAELDHNRTELRTAKSKLSSVQAEYDKLKVIHEGKMKESQVELKTKLDQLSSDLDTKWKSTLKNECDKLRRQLVAEKDEDKRAALDQLTRLKEEEAQATKLGWEKKVQELLAQISELKQSIQCKEQLRGDELERVRAECGAESRRLQRELEEAVARHEREKVNLEGSYNDQLTELTALRDRAMKDVQETLLSQHRDELQAQITAHKAALDALRSSLEQTRLTDLQQQARQHNIDTETLRSELEQRHIEELDELTREHGQELQAARMELERAIELLRQKEAEYTLHGSELEETIRHREETIRQLETDIRRLQGGVDDMAKDLEAKGREILRIRSEANAATRSREDQLQREHRAEVERLLNIKQRESEQTLAEFTEAQELLKDKISERQLMLEEAEQRYMDRESRPEDLDMIRRLKHAVHEREENLKKIQDDKKFFQRELVNRETNFNKVFNADPKVGVLNPLGFSTHKKSKGERTSGRGSTSSPALSNRLEPIPGSVLHEGPLHGNRPLPSTMKKFVK